MISICIPTYEQDGTGHEKLSQLLMSIFMQNCRDNIEVVISDNSKDDKVHKTCIEFAGKLDIKYIHNNKTFGVSANTNNAISHASYDLIKPMYQDDMFISDKAVSFFITTLNYYGWSVCKSTIVDETNRVKALTQPHYQEDMAFYNTIGMPSVIAFRKCEARFKEDLLFLLDADFYKQLYEKYGKPVIGETSFVLQRIWSGSQTSTLDDVKRFKELDYYRSKYNTKESKVIYIGEGKFSNVAK